MIIVIKDNDHPSYDFLLSVPEGTTVEDVDRAIISVKEARPEAFNTDDLLAALPGSSILHPPVASEVW